MVRRRPKSGSEVKKLKLLEMCPQVRGCVRDVCGTSNGALKLRLSRTPRIWVLEAGSCSRMPEQDEDRQKDAARRVDRALLLPNDADGRGLESIQASYEQVR